MRASSLCLDSNSAVASSSVFFLFPNSEDKNPCFLSFAIACGYSWGKVVGVDALSRAGSILGPNAVPNITVDQELDTDSTFGPSPDGHRR